MADTDGVDTDGVDTDGHGESVRRGRLPARSTGGCPATGKRAAGGEACGRPTRRRSGLEAPCGDVARPLAMSRPAAGDFGQWGERVAPDQAGTSACPTWPNSSPPPSVVPVSRYA